MPDLPRPRPNRVTPFGKAEASTAKGAFMGNRGDLHGPDGAISKSHSTSTWICCTLSYGNARVRFDTKGHYTPLFFHDEAVALSAGHRPCALCRRPDYLRFRSSFATALKLHPDARLLARTMDGILHRDRLERREKKRFKATLSTLPDNVFFTLPGEPENPLLLRQMKALPFTHAGYGKAFLVEAETVVDVLTPAAMVGVLNAGYQPLVRL